MGVNINDVSIATVADDDLHQQLLFSVKHCNVLRSHPRVTCRKTNCEAIRACQAWIV